MTTITREPLSPEERHYEQIRVKTREHRAALRVYWELRGRTSEAKQQAAKLDGELQALLDRGPLLPIFDPPAASEPAPESDNARDESVCDTPVPGEAASSAVGTNGTAVATADALPAPPRGLAPWPERPLSFLALEMPVIASLSHAGIKTLGDLNNLYAQQRSIASLKHCDQQTARTVRTAWNAYVKLHPEVDGD